LKCDNKIATEGALKFNRALVQCPAQAHDNLKDGIKSEISVVIMLAKPTVTKGLRSGKKILKKY